MPRKISLIAPSTYAGMTLKYSHKLLSDVVVPLSYEQTIIITEPDLVRDRHTGLFEYQGKVGVFVDTDGSKICLR